MMDRRRGVLAALFITGATLSAPALPSPALAATELAPGETVLSDGLTMEVRHSPGSGSVALEIWVRCPANGWTSAQPGIARLTALAAVDAKSGNTTLRDTVHARGGEVGVSIFQTATEFVVLSPADQAPVLEDALMRAVFRSTIDSAALDQARTRLAAEQAISAQSAAAVLRDKVFATIFTNGPLHDAPLGDAKLLQSASLTEVRDFAAHSYVPSASAVIALGNGDANALRAHIAAASPSEAGSTTLPGSAIGSVPSAPIALTNPDVDGPGVALGWAGPPISDRRAATAMDFLSDYLTDPKTGVFANAATSTTAGASIDGQYVTLEQSGLFFVSATGTGVDPATMEKSLRDALDQVVTRSISRGGFAAALSAYETRLLRQMDSPQGLADNYGWYFAMNAPSYAPSATDVSLSGEYFAAAASLTPDYVRDVAHRYLGVAPVVVTITPQKPSAAMLDGGGS
ncbi:MAG TPA: insulinase family protein [Candidatus Eremiobacteraceae bacterium]|nr:insulinase family protein [Candidatus Eremiobacteraceae bacterium]